MKITVVGAGYVGLSNAVFLAQNHDVILLDVVPEKVNLINAGKSPIADNKIEDFLQSKRLSLRAVCNKQEAYSNADFIIIAVPTDYDPKNNGFDTHAIETVIQDTQEFKSNAILVIKSTVPVGYTQKIQKQMGVTNLLFSPEFLREGKALHDNLNPSRIVVGGDKKTARAFSNLLLEGALKKEVSVLLTGTTEAEAIKLFANTYLAMRVSYFNELDTYAQAHALNASQIIEGIGLDPRIGLHYNNPSFGYGGYCLPKDTQQLRASYGPLPQNLIQAIIDSNATRKDYIADQVIKKSPKRVGVYRLAMKIDSDNFRSSSIQGVIERLQEHNIQIVIYEPALKEVEFFGCRIEKNLATFKQSSDIIITNRWHSDLDDVSDKVYSRDVFGSDS